MDAEVKFASCVCVYLWGPIITSAVGSSKEAADFLNSV